MKRTIINQQAAVIIVLSMLKTFYSAHLYTMENFYNPWVKIWLRSMKNKLKAFNGNKFINMEEKNIFFYVDRVSSIEVFTSLLTFEVRNEDMAEQVEIFRAILEDAIEILDLQKLVYQSEAQIYDDWSIPLSFELSKRSEMSSVPVCSSKLSASTSS